MAKPPYFDRRPLPRLVKLELRFLREMLDMTALAFRAKQAVTRMDRPRVTIPTTHRERV